MLAAILLAHFVPFALSQAVAWKEELNPKGYPDYSARYSLFESPRRDTLSCSILITRDGNTMYVIAEDPTYVFPNDPDKLVWNMGQTISFTKKPDGTVNYTVGWGATRFMTDIFASREHPEIFGNQFAKYAKLLPRDVQDRFAGHYGIGTSPEQK
jgi:hypothetical protein